MNIDEKLVDSIFPLVFGVIGGGIFSFYQRKKYAQIDDKIEAKRKLKKYAKSLWLDLHELQLRLESIKKKVENNDTHALEYNYDTESSIKWFTQNGYYLTSTAYLFSSLSSWIAIYQRDVTFLDFDSDKITSNFFEKIEGIKQAISNVDKGSIMYYFYYNGIGENIIDENKNTPISFAQFINNLDEDVRFHHFYSQIFHFLNSLSSNSSIDLICGIVEKIEDCKLFLEQNAELPKIL